MFSTNDFKFDLTEHPFQLIHWHRTAVQENWDKYHAHQGMEFIFVHHGKGIVIIDQNIYTFGPGTLMYFQPFQLHRVKAELADEEHYVRSKFLFEPSLIDGYLDHFAAVQHFFRYLWQGRLPAQVINLADTGTDLPAILELYRAKEPGGRGQTIEEFALFVSVFFQFLQGCWQRQGEDSKNIQFRHVHYAEEIMRWVDAHFQEEFTLNALAQQLHLSNCHISHLFRKATGSSITEYLISRRLREACLLLRTTPASVQEIADGVGITNVSYFCQLFKKKYGETPAQYRTKAAR
ncbi:MAG: AraC family transcriptional regulator [Negativicutes bacterium]|nr:AraC family transcriptional regulator [Negativicutes bacterium]